MINYEQTAKEWAMDYANDIEKWENRCFKSKPYRFCIEDMYNWFLAEGRIVKLETLPKEHKTELYNNSMQIFPQSTDKKTRRELCIFVYFMNFIFEKYFKL